MTLTSLASPLAALIAGLTDFGSVFLVVTEAFNCTEANFSSVSDKFFFVGVTVALVSFGAAARTALGAVLALDCFAATALAAVAGDFTAFTAVVVTLPEGLATGVFFVTDRAATGVDLLAGLLLPALLAALTEVRAAVAMVDLLLDLAFLAEGVGFFAVFFIAFAIESTAK